MKLFCAAMCICLALPAFAQTRSAIPDEDLAKEHWGHGNYSMALPIYIALQQKSPKDFTYNERVGICYLMTNGHKSLAESYLITASKDPKAENDVWLYLGEAYQNNLKFDDAITAYQTYELKCAKDEKLDADHRIEQCRNGKILVATPLDVSFTNLGKDINSEYPDYYPFVTSDESMLIFTSRRKGNMGATSVEMDGYYASDIWYSKSTNGVFAKAKGAGPGVNGNFDEQCTGLSADGKTMTVYVDNITSAGDIYQSTFKTSFSKLEKLPDVVNSGFETSASYSPDGNMVFFASKRDGGQGGTDIYVCKKLPGNFGWGQAYNIANINTPYNEDFPTMAPDGKTLYFASEGHNSMGGYDIFETTYNEDDNSWSTPRNIGYPINTPENEYTISFTENNRVAYITSDREGGQGDMDIWRAVFNEVQATAYTIVTGVIMGADSTLDYSGLEIEVSDKDNNPIGSYRFNVATKKYVMALPPGKYVMNMDVPGYQSYVSTVNVFDIGPQGEMSKDILLVKQ